LKTGEYHSNVLHFLLGNMQSCDAFRPIARKRKYLMDYYWWDPLFIPFLCVGLRLIVSTICVNAITDVSTLVWILLSFCTAIPRPSRSIVLWREKKSKLSWSHLKPDFIISVDFVFLFFLIQGLHARTTRVLLFMVIPGNLIFLYTIRVLQAGHTTLTLIFTSGYLMAGLIQVSFAKCNH